MKSTSLCFTLLTLLGICASGARIDQSMWLSVPWESGAISLGDGGSDMFFWLFPPKDKNLNAPLMFWLSGGPGCSSSVAIFYENGPYSFDSSDPTKLIENPNSWNEKVYMLYVDNPIGTGFSRAKDPASYCFDENCIADNMYTFLLKWYDLYPQFKLRKFYMSGESYAGHYLPSIAHKIIRMDNKDINLQSIAIGNPWVDPYSQYGEYSYYAYANGLLSSPHYLFNRFGMSVCQFFVDMGYISLSEKLCYYYYQDILESNPDMDPFNIKQKKKPKEFSELASLMEITEVKRDLGVPHRKFELCDHTAQADLLEKDLMFSTMYAIEGLLDGGINVLIYAGMDDLACNWMGNDVWIRKLKWTYKSRWALQPWAEWKQDGELKAYYKGYQNFAFVKIKNAGHFVPMDQPAFAKLMIQRFVDDFQDL